MFIFFVICKNVRIESCPSENVSDNKIPWSYVGLYKFCIHLKNLNVRHFGVVAATALILWHRGYLQWHDLPAEFHKNLPIGSKGDRWGQTHKHTDRVVTSKNGPVAFCCEHGEKYSDGKKSKTTELKINALQSVSAARTHFLHIVSSFQMRLRFCTCPATAIRAGSAMFTEGQ
jgi:hypothetical protein